MIAAIVGEEVGFEISIIWMLRLIEAIEFEIILKVGIILPQFGTQATKGNVVWLAKTAEEEHFDSLWVGERLLWPLNPQSQSIAGSLPIEQQIILDPLETLAYVAANRTCFQCQTHLHA
jgi:hypothetical protein